MSESHVDHRIDQLLNDPLVSLMIQADKVDRTALANNLRNLRPWRELAVAGCGNRTK